MDAGGRPGLGWWWWLRQGPGWRGGGAQEQRQAAFERPHRAGRRGSTPEKRPRSPMKDKPAARRPPAGPRIDDPGPPGWGVRIGGAQARAGPTYLRRQGDSHPAAQVRNAHRAPARPCLPGAQPCHLRRAWSACAWSLRIRPKVGHLRFALCLRALQAASRPVGPTWRRPQNDARRDLGGRAWGAVTREHAAGRLPHRQAAPPRGCLALRLRSRCAGFRGAAREAASTGRGKVERG